MLSLIHICNATYRNGTFIAEDGTDLLVLFKEKAKNGAGYEPVSYTHLIEMASLKDMNQLITYQYEADRMDRQW